MNGGAFGVVGVIECESCRNAPAVRVVHFPGTIAGGGTIFAVCDGCAPNAARARVHGTHSAYNVHRKRGEKPCEMCSAGESLYGRARRAGVLLRRIG